MRMSAHNNPDTASSRTAVPAELLRRLAFGRPQRRPVQPALAVTPGRAATAGAAVALDDLCDLDQRVRQSGEW